MRVNSNNNTNLSHPRTSWEILGGTHGNEQFGIDLAIHIMCNPIAGISANFPNPIAAIRGKRMVDEEEMMSHYINLDNPQTYTQRQAAEQAKRAGQVTGGVFDIHNNSIDGLTFIDLDSRYVRPRILEAAVFASGFTRVLVERNTSIYEAMPNACALEFYVPEDADEYAAEAAERIPMLCKRLGELANYDNSETLDIPRALTFYERVGSIPRDHPLVSELEEIQYETPITHGFEQLPESATKLIREFYELKDDRLYMTSWNFVNQSEGRYFGGFARQIDVPEQYRGYFQTAMDRSL